MSDFLKNLALDSWFKLCIYSGFVLFFVSLFVEPKWLTSEQVGYAGLFLFFLGIGEWKNEKKQYEIKPPNAYTGPAAFLEYTVRRPDGLGTTFLLISLLFLFLLVKSFF